MITCSEGKQYLRYSDYLKSAHWNKKKAEYKQKFEYKCSMCESSSNLDLHHTTYERVGNESLDDLIYLCRTCHNLIHKVDKSEKLTDLNAMINQYRKKRRNKKKPTTQVKEKQPHYVTVIREVPLDSSLEFSTHKNRNKPMNKRTKKTIVNSLKRMYSDKDFDNMNDVDLMKWYSTLTKEIKSSEKR